MSDLPTWEAKLSVLGPIKTRGTHEFKIFKTFRYEDPFYSDIGIETSTSGVDASVTSFASTNALAHQAGHTFFGQMLDSLALMIRQPLFLIYTDTRPIRNENHMVRRLVEEAEWITSFKESRSLNEYEPSFLRALGWYRKALYTEDSFDKFLAFWNSIEVTASKYHTKDEKTKKVLQEHSENDKKNRLVNKWREKVKEDEAYRLMDILNVFHLDIYKGDNSLPDKRFWI